ncbi:Armadillo-type fold [Phytophthora cactorum]|nr:Armadillo-type fold [Phytophthora cactorum]
MGVQTPVWTSDLGVCTTLLGLAADTLANFSASLVNFSSNAELRRQNFPPELIYLATKLALMDHQRYVASAQDARILLRNAEATCLNELLRTLDGKLLAAAAEDTGHSRRLRYIYELVISNLLFDNYLQQVVYGDQVIRALVSGFSFFEPSVTNGDTKISALLMPNTSLNSEKEQYQALNLAFDDDQERFLASVFLVANELMDSANIELVVSLVLPCLRTYMDLIASIPPMPLLLIHNAYSCSDGYRSHKHFIHSEETEAMLIAVSALPSGSGDSSTRGSVSQAFCAATLYHLCASNSANQRIIQGLINCCNSIEESQALLACSAAFAITSFTAEGCQQLVEFACVWSSAELKDFIVVALLRANSIQTKQIHAKTLCNLLSHGESRAKVVEDGVLYALMKLSQVILSGSTVSGDRRGITVLDTTVAASSTDEVFSIGLRALFNLSCENQYHSKLLSNGIMAYLSAAVEYQQQTSLPGGRHEASGTSFLFKEDYKPQKQPQKQCVAGHLTVESRRLALAIICNLTSYEENHKELIRAQVTEIIYNYADGDIEARVSAAMALRNLSCCQPWVEMLCERKILQLLIFCMECDHPAARQFAVEALANCSHFVGTDKLGHSRGMWTHRCEHVYGCSKVSTQHFSRRRSCVTGYGGESILRLLPLLEYRTLGSDVEACELTASLSHTLAAKPRCAELLLRQRTAVQVVWWKKRPQSTHAVNWYPVYYQRSDKPMKICNKLIVPGCLPVRNGKVGFPEKNLFNPDGFASIHTRVPSKPTSRTACVAMEGNRGKSSKSLSSWNNGTATEGEFDNKNKTWLFLPGSDERSKTSKGVGKSSITGVDRPSRRVDKWSDVVMGELESMLMVSFLEQGVVLRKARILYAKTFFQLENLYKSQWQDLIQEQEEVEYLREERYETEIDKLKTTFESDKSEMERRLADSKEQMTKMGDTMKTLNAIFRQMREDTEKVKAVELRENYGRLEHKYEQCREEIEQLRPVVQEKQQLQSRIDELIRDRDVLKDQITELHNLVDTKDTVIASLMEQQSNLIAAQDLKAAREEEMRRQAEEEKEYERDDALTLTGTSNGPASGVCVRCKQDLRTVSANGGLTEADKGPETNNSFVNNEAEAFKLPKKRRIQCLYFRILLPNLNGRRPQRDISWTFSCMRSIMFAKQIDDSMCKRTAGLFPLRIRMPEFVYAWFAPWKSLKEEKSIAEEDHLDGGTDTEVLDDPNDPNSAQHQQMQANEDRWCLYYGYVVTNVPEDERPENFLEPKTTIEPDEEQTKKRRGKINDETIDGNLQEPLHFVDANLWVELMMLEYKEEQAHRRAAIRLMFQTATSAAAAASGSVAEMSLSAMLGINYASMDMEQFRAMVHTLNDEIPSFMVATLFRNAYSRGNGTVNFDSFMDAAETSQFFSTCMRLESPSSVVSRILGHPFSRSPVLMTPSSRAAFIVGKFFAILGNEIGSTIEELPLWTRSMTDSLAYEISSTLLEGSYSDGARLLTLFQRLIDNLGVAKLIRRETTGCLFSSSDLCNIEKALNGLLDFARQREKSSYVYLWIESSMQSTHICAVLGELSGISGAFHAGRSSPLQLTVSSSLNGGIGPTPKPVFVELIYDFFLEKLGARCEAERLIHDVFANCRSLVRTDSLALLFSHLCCMSNSCPEDRLLGQNEALAFLHAIFRCGLHSFRLVTPSSELPSEVSQEDPDSAPVGDKADFVAIDVVENILQTAFSKLSSDQKTRLKLRITDAATDKNPSEVEANAFLVLALHEWRRYILYRLNEIRVACCAVEAELTHFEDLLQLETVATILQKTDITFTPEDLCVILRRLYITEKAPTKSSDTDSGDMATLTLKPDPMSERIAAACFPLVAKETMNGLQRLAPRRFEIKPGPLQSYEFLVSTWEDYQETCRELLEEFREIGKNNDIQATAQHRSPMKLGMETVADCTI